jgi:hypothetical protein
LRAGTSRTRRPGAPWARTRTTWRRSGQEFVDCLLASTFTFTGAFDDPDRYATLSCFTETCSKVSPLTRPFLNCLAENEGPTGCEDKMAELQAATCD